MDAKRKVTVLDLETDGAAAIDERRRKVEAAAERKSKEGQDRMEERNSLSGRPVMDNDAIEMASDVESRQSIQQIHGQEPETKPMGERGDRAREELRTREEQRFTKVRRDDQNTTQRHVSSFEHQKDSAVSDPPRVPVEKPERRSVTQFDVSCTKTSREPIKQSAKRNMLRVEYTAAPAAPTETTGSYFVDEFNRFMDEWLVPRELISQGNETMVPGGITGGYLARDVQIVQTPSSQDQRQTTSAGTGIDWRSCFATCYGCGGAGSPEACPTCKQPMGGAEERGRPSLSRKWTRWIFRQCEEPLDMEAEFLVTPRARLTHTAERDGGCYRRVITPYQTLMLGVTQ